MRPAARSLSRVLFTLSGLVLAPVLTPATAAAQDTTTAPMSATMLRRLAEAVDAQRNDRTVWVVVQQQFPHTVKGVYYSPMQAAALSARLEGYVVRGPFRTAPDSGTRTLMYAIQCHDEYSQCTDTTSSSSVAAVPREDVDSVAVTIYSHGAAAIHQAFSRPGVDALFFSLSAMDKFVIPYYTRLNGPEAAARMRADYLRRVSRPAAR